MIRRLRHFLANQRGATALEYAMVMPLLFSVIFVAVEITFILFADAQLEASANLMTRAGKIGIKDSTGKLVRPSCTDLQNIMQASMSRWVYGNNTANLHFDARVYHPDGSTSTSCSSGAEGDMVLYTISVDRKGFTGFITLLGQGSTWRSSRSLLIQNEL
jgi:Flp pilus assembly protein TadG